MRARRGKVVPRRTQCTSKQRDEEGQVSMSCTGSNGLGAAHDHQPALFVFGDANPKTRPGGSSAIISLAVASPIRGSLAESAAAASRCFEAPFVKGNKGQP